MSKIDYSFNITSFLLLVAVVFLIVLFTRQCSSYSRLSDGLVQQEATYETWRSNIASSYREQAKEFQDTIEYYQSLYNTNKIKADTYKARIDDLQSDMKTIRAQVEQIPTDTTYSRLTSSITPIGSLNYPFADNQVKELYIQQQENAKCKELVEELETKNKYLDISMKANSEINVNLQKEFDACDNAITDMEQDFAQVVADKNKYKKKLNRNRILATCTTILALIVIL